MNLLCLSDFNQGDVCAKAGDMLTFSDGVAHRLLDSWPGCWAVAEVAEVDRLIGMADDLVNNAAIEAPPVDKMMHAPNKAKGKRGG